MKGFFSKHGLWILFLTCVLSVTICIISFFGVHTPVLENIAGTITSPFRNMIVSVTNYFTNLKMHFEEYTYLLEENEALRLQISEMEERVRQGTLDTMENERLRKLLGLREKRRDMVFETAVITARNVNNWVHSLTLDSGTELGIEIGDCVITAEGYLVGIVEDVGHSWCTVLTLTDTSTEIGAQVLRTGALGVAIGDFTLMEQDRLKLTFVKADSIPQIGDCIITSGLGGYCPSEIVIGEVENIYTDVSGLSQYAIIKPLANIDALTQVFIIKDFDVIQ